MLVSVGLDFQRAPLDVRERFHLGDTDVPRVGERLARLGARESVLARTCNRVEVYCWWDEEMARAPGADPVRDICRAWVANDHAEAEILRASASARSSEETVRHLFRVASGLESQILGDIHILGQVRRALLDAVEVGSVGTQLHRLFETALRVGRRVKRETLLTARRNSVGSEAARRAAAIRDGVADQVCRVVGCGKSGAHAARALQRLGARDVGVLNRTPSRGEALARELGDAHFAGLGALASELVEADIVIVATGAPEPVLAARHLAAARALGRAEGRPLLVIDVSVPRNVHSDVRDVEGTELVDLDTLRVELSEIERSRLEAVPLAEALVECHVEEFAQWLELREARRALTPFHQVLAEVCRREVSYLAGESPGAMRTADRIVARVMAHPMMALRAATARGERIEQAVGTIGELFEAADARRGRASDGRHRDTRRAQSTEVSSVVISHRQVSVSG